MVASKPITLDGQAPEWARRAFRDVEAGFVKAVPTAPQLLAQFPSSDLPSAADYPWCVIAVTDLTCVALSTGSQWVRADGSAL